MLRRREAVIISYAWKELTSNLLCDTYQVLNPGRVQLILPLENMQNPAATVLKMQSQGIYPPKYLHRTLAVTCGPTSPNDVGVDAVAYSAGEVFICLLFTFQRVGRK